MKTIINIYLPYEIYLKMLELSMGTFDTILTLIFSTQIDILHSPDIQTRKNKSFLVLHTSYIIIMLSSLEDVNECNWKHALDLIIA